MFLRPQHRIVAPAALYGGGVLTEDYTAADTMTWVTHARTGHAMMFDSTGKLTWAPNNLFTYNNTFNNGVWSTSNSSLSSGVSDPLSGTSAWTLTATGANGELSRAYNGPTSTAGMCGIWMRRRTGSGAVYVTNSAGSNADVTSQISSSWALISSSGAALSTGFFWKVLLSTSGDAVDIYLASISAVTYESSPRSVDQFITTASEYYGPRMDYNPATLAKRGLLREMSRTNLLEYSSAIDNAYWTKTNSSITTAAAVAPDGTTTACKIVEDSSTGHHNALRNIYPASSTVFTFSAFLKSAGRTSAYVALDVQNPDVHAVFNLSNGTVTSTDTQGGDLVASIVDAGNSWYRVIMTCTSGGNGQFAPWIGPYNGARSYAGDGSSGIYVWGAQVEQASSPTSHIPTSGSTVNRAADALTAALYSADSVTEYYRLVSDLSQSNRTVNPFSGVTDETDSVWIEKFTKP